MFRPEFESAAPTAGDPEAHKHDSPLAAFLLLRPTPHARPAPA